MNKLTKIKNVALFILVFVVSWILAAGFTILICRIADMPWSQINIGIGLSLVVFIIYKGRDFVQTIKDELSDEE